MIDINDQIVSVNPEMTIRNFKELVLGIVGRPFFLQFNLPNEKRISDLIRI